MKPLWAVLALVCSTLGAEASWNLSDALGTVGDPAPQAQAGKGWVLRIEPRPSGEERTLFQDGRQESVRLVDFDPAGRVTRTRDLRNGVAIWEVAYDPATGLPTSETVFEDDQPVEVATLEFSAGVLVHRTVRNASQRLLYEDRLMHWPDGTLRRLERDGPQGPLAEAAWSYGSGGRLAGAWAVDEDARDRGDHREWIYSPGRTDEVLATESTVLVSRVTEWLEAGRTRETKTDQAASRQEVRLADAQGRTTEEVVTVKGVTVQTRRWKYDDQGRILEASVDSAGPQEVWTYTYQDGLTLGTLTRDGILVREETVKDGEKQTVKWYDRGDLFLVETWDAGKRTKETYYRKGVVVRERTP